MHIALLLMLSNFFFWPSPLDWQMSQQNVALRGTVVDERSGGPLAGAVVYATSPGFVARTISDSKGDFIFLTLLPGAYRLCASKHGYVVDCYPRASEPGRLYAGFEYGATIVLSHALN